MGSSWIGSGQLRLAGPWLRSASISVIASRSLASQSDSLSATRRTHQESASLRDRATPASINVSKSKEEVFGISLAPAAIIEGFAVFAFVFALVLAGGIPGEA